MPTHADPAAANKLVPACLWLALIASTALLLLVANRGFDLTDESFYISWIADPGRYTATVSGFAFPLHLIFVVLDQSIPGLRMVGVLLLILSGGVLGVTLERYCACIGHMVPRGVFVAMGSLTALSYYALWVLTPSYNLLANVAAALLLSGGIAWLVADREGRFGLRPAAVLLGVGGGLAFLSRPPLAVIGAILAAVLILRTMRRHSFAKTSPSALLTGATCLVFLVAMIESTVGIVAFADMIRVANQLFFANGSMTQMPLNAFNAILARRRFVLALLVLAAAILANRTDRLRTAPYLNEILAVVAGLFALLAFHQLLQGYASPLRVWRFIGIPLCTIVVALVSAAVALHRHAAVRGEVLLPIVLLLAMPFAIGLGSIEDNAAQTGAAVGGFLLAAALSAALLLRPQPAAALLIGCAAGTCAILISSSFRPYGETDPVLQQVHPVLLPVAGNILYTSRDHQRYVAGLQQIAREEGLTAATPVLDLSPGGPGTGLALGGSRPLVPWVMAVPGPEGRQGAIADAAFRSLSPADRDAAWIVGPIRPEFRHSQVARHLNATAQCYRFSAMPRPVIWGKRQAISVWIPDRDCLRSRRSGKWRNGGAVRPMDEGGQAPGSNI